MARPVRLKFGGALHHVTARGDRREAIYEDDTDREHFLEVLGQVVGQFNWRFHAYSLMSNHRHHRTGHLFQGRYKAILVDADSYLLELTPLHLLEVWNCLSVI